jgi:LruC domain-containing protein
MKMINSISLRLFFIAFIIFQHSNSYAEATYESFIENSDGSFTFTQKISSDSSAPHYIAPSGYGFSVYSWFNEDYGWQHNFPLWNDDTYKIISATLLIRGWDVDSEPSHGTNGEYDGIAIDGVDLNPGLLQGENRSWSETSFSVPINAINDDGLINTFINIDMNHTQNTWATTLDYSLLTITYIASSSNPPSQPLLDITPSTAVGENDDLSISVIGPTPADPDNDSVTYSYRWYVDVGQGFFVDDEFAGKTNHQGNTVSASETSAGERWKVEVYPTDSNGIVGQFETASWYTIGDSDNDGVLDESDDFPEDADRAFLNYMPASGKNTLAFEDRWPQKGDYDMNDLVLYYRYTIITNTNNDVKQIILDANAVSRGGDQNSAFAISFPGTDDGNVESNKLIINGIATTISPEEGHTGELVYTLINDSKATLPADTDFRFYNTEIADERAIAQLNFDISFTEAVATSSIGIAPYNPFIFSSQYRGREIHLRNKPPTDLADERIFHTGDDASIPDTGSYYRTIDNLPWAIDISGEWKHPLEKVDVLQSYPKMSEWIESLGVSAQNWHLHPSSGRCWKCN